MNTKTQIPAFLGLGAMSLLTAVLGGATSGCVADRPSRNAVFDENQYIRKDFLVRPGDSNNPDYGWMLKATVTDASEPNVFGDPGVYGLFAGSHSSGDLVHFVITSDKLQMLSNRAISAVQSVGVEQPIVNAWPITNVDLKYQINMDGEKTNLYTENQELDWQVRQWVKLNLDRNDMADLAPLGSYVTANVAKCGTEASSTLVPNSFIVDEAHDYIEWSTQITIGINWADATCVDSYGALGQAAQKLGRDFETVTLKYSMMRAVPNPTYQPLIIAEKDPILHKYGPQLWMTWNRDPDTLLLASNQYAMRHDPKKDQRWYFEKGFRPEYKAIFTRNNLPAGVAPLPANIPTIEEATNQVLVDAFNGQKAAKAANPQAPDPTATGRVSFHEYNEPLDDGTPIERSFGDVRFNMVRWVESVDQQSYFAGATAGVVDPRTGELLSSDIVFENGALKDYYVARIDAYLQSIGASQNALSAADWTPPTDLQGTALPCTDSLLGTSVPIVQDTVVKSHNGQSTLFQKIQQYLFKPVGAFGPLGPQDFIIPSDDDFLRAYFTYLPYIVYGDPEMNPYVTPSSDSLTANTTAPSEMMFSLLANEQQFHALSGMLDHGWAPFDASSAAGETDALAFLNTYKALSINHRNLKYAKLSMPLRANGVTPNVRADAVTDFSLEQVMARDARHCVAGTAAIPGDHWETKDEWINSLITTYWSQTFWHEFGHAMGLEHNFMASVDRNNFPVETDSSGNAILDQNGNPRYKLYSSSVMEYNSNPDRVFWGAGWGSYDKAAIAWLYSNNGATPTSAGTAQGISGQTSSTAPWNDPDGFQGATETQFLYCNERHAKYTPLCRPGDFGITPSEITANELDAYEWQYQWRNYRTYHKVWDDSNYADQPLDFITEQRRFLSLWTYDMSDSELIAVFERLGINPPPDAPSAQAYYNALTNKFNTEMSGAANLTAAFHEAIIQQSSGQRPFVTQFDNYFGDVTLQGISLDKVDALQSFLTLWPVDNYDQNQGAGAYIASYTPFGINSGGASDTGNGSLYETVAETAVDSMLGGAFASFPYQKPLAVAAFDQDTHSINFTAFDGRPEVRDWAGGWSFTRLSDFLAFFQDIAVQNGFKVQIPGGANIDCTIPAGCDYDPRTPRAFANDTFYSDNTNRFTAPDGKRYIWVYIPSRNEWITCDQDRHTATYSAMFNYTLDVIQSYDDGNTPGGAFGAEVTLDYFADFFDQSKVLSY